MDEELKNNAKMDNKSGPILIVSPAYAEKLEKDGFVKKINPDNWQDGYEFTEKELTP